MNGQALFNSTTIPVLEQMVDFAQARHNVLAGNPDYLARARAVNPAFPASPFTASFPSDRFTPESHETGYPGGELGKWQTKSDTADDGVRRGGARTRPGSGNRQGHSEREVQARVADANLRVLDPARRPVVAIGR